MICRHVFTRMSECAYPLSNPSLRACSSSFGFVVMQFEITLITSRRALSNFAKAVGDESRKKRAGSPRLNSVPQQHVSLRQREAERAPHCSVRRTLQAHSCRLATDVPRSSASPARYWRAPIPHGRGHARETRGSPGLRRVGDQDPPAHAKREETSRETVSPVAWMR